jgi:hypothetical protein
LIRRITQLTMDKTLTAAWNNRSKPFHRKTFFACDIPIATLRQVLQSIVAHCERSYSRSDCVMIKFEDWHAHDGRIVGREATSFAAIHALLASDEALIQSGLRDHDVFQALYPNSNDFLLRYAVYRNQDNTDELIDQSTDESAPFAGAFSFTGHGFDFQEISKRLHEFDQLSIQRQNSKEYFDAIYAG